MLNLNKLVVNKTAAISTPTPRSDQRAVITEGFPDLLTFGVKTRATMHTENGKHFLRGFAEINGEVEEYSLKLGNLNPGASLLIMNPSKHLQTTVGASGYLAELASVLNNVGKIEANRVDCEVILRKSQNRLAESSTTLAVTVNLECIGHADLWLVGLTVSINLYSAVQFAREANNAALRAYNKVAAFNLSDFDTDN